MTRHKLDMPLEQEIKFAAMGNIMAGFQDEVMSGIALAHSKLAEPEKVLLRRKLQELQERLIKLN